MRTLVRASVPAVTLAASITALTACRPDERLPTLSSDAFWNLSARLSEPPGIFAHSENLVSNESRYAQTIGRLRPTGGVYIGVGPEQNFSYIANLEPDMAFVVDIRRENRALHLWYKALFEISVNRIEFVSRLFSRDPPTTVDEGDGVDALFTALDTATPSDHVHRDTQRLVRERLLAHHRFSLEPHDLAWIDHVAAAFMTDGPAIHYARSRQGSPAGPSYRRLMTVRDLRGQSRSYLATEAAFGVVKSLHARNLIVPVVGDFSGPLALRHIGDFVRQHGAAVSAFYGSNVEVYLTNDQRAVFCATLAALPWASRATFIGPRGARPVREKLETCKTATP